MKNEADAASLLKRAGTAADPCAGVEAALQALVGHRLFTVMVVDHARGEAARIYSSRPEVYPVRGRKALGELTGWGKHVIEGARPWIGRTAEDIRWAFFDHEIIAGLGCESCMNLPVLHEGRVIGTVNLLHEAGFYGPEDVEAATPFAALLTPRLLTGAG